MEHAAKNIYIYHIVSQHIISYITYMYHITYHIIYHITSHHIVSYRIISYIIAYITSYITSHPIVSYHVSYHNDITQGAGPQNLQYLPILCAYNLREKKVNSHLPSIRTSVTMELKLHPLPRTEGF